MTTASKLLEYISWRGTLPLEEEVNAGALCRALGLLGPPREGLTDVGIWLCAPSQEPLWRGGHETKGHLEKAPPLLVLKALWNKHHDPLMLEILGWLLACENRQGLPRVWAQPHQDHHDSFVWKLQLSAARHAALYLAHQTQICSSLQLAGIITHTRFGEFLRSFEEGRLSPEMGARSTRFKRYLKFKSEDENTIFEWRYT